GVQKRDTVRVGAQPFPGHGLNHAQSLILEIIGAQNQARQLIGPIGQKLLSLVHVKSFPVNRLVEQNLDVHFLVRAVHAAGVVDKVVVDYSAFHIVINTPQLGKSEVQVLTN